MATSNQAVKPDTPYDMRSYAAGFANGQAHGGDAVQPAPIKLPPPPTPRMDYSRGWEDGRALAKIEHEAEILRLLAEIAKTQKAADKQAVTSLVALLASFVVALGLIAIATWKG